MTLVWFITGVSSGFGLEIALYALSQNYNLIGTVRSLKKAATPVERIESAGGKVLQLDITHAEECFELWESAAQVYGRIDVLCNNAGMSYMGALEDFT